MPSPTRWPAASDHTAPLKSRATHGEVGQKAEDFQETARWTSGLQVRSAAFSEQLALGRSPDRVVRPVSIAVFFMYTRCFRNVSFSGRLWCLIAAAAIRHHRACGGAPSCYFFLAVAASGA